MGKYKVGERVYWLHNNIQSKKDKFEDKKVIVIILEKTDRTYKIQIEGTDITKFVKQDYFEDKVLEAARI